MGFTIPNFADAAYQAQAEPDAGDLRILSDALGCHAVQMYADDATSLLVEAQASPNMTVRVAAGIIRALTVSTSISAAASVAIAAAHASLPRIDLVCATASGAVAVLQGTPATAPVFPAIPVSTHVVLAAVYVPPAVTAITSAMIVDKRAPAPASVNLLEQAIYVGGGAPGPSNDGPDWGFYAGSVWVDETTGVVWMCLDASAGAAVWISIADGPMRTGTWYPGEGATTGSVAQGLVRAIPFVVRRKTTFSAIGCEVTTAGEAGSLIRLGIYADDGTGRPGGSPYLDAGTVAGDGATGFRTITTTYTLNPGVWWRASCNQACPTTAPTTRVTNQAAERVPYTGTPSATTPVSLQSSNTANTGALPAFGTPSVQGNSSRVLCKVA